MKCAWQPLLCNLKIENMIFGSEIYPRYQETCLYGNYSYSFPVEERYLPTGRYFLVILGHFGPISDRSLLRYHGNPDRKVIIFRNTITKGHQKCI